jgi:hypothetical protein
MSTPPDARVETLGDPQRYTRGQLTAAQRIATQLNRGSLILCEAPRL